jgi:RNA polymerase sigma-70 factor (ECF subfamily)
MTNSAIAIDELERHRTALTGHCYRMLGSVSDADDAVQETLVRAWKSLDRFDGRSRLGTWLYRIATNVCLDALAGEKRRARPVEDGPRGTVEDELRTRERTHWLEPIPDAQAIPVEADPATRAELRQSIRLAFVAALQHLPARQRAALLLTDVLGFSVADVAESIEATVPAVNSALQRARATLQARDLSAGKGPLSDAQLGMLDRYVEAFERYDVDTLAGMLRDDAVLSMPPYTLWLQGPSTIATWFLGRGAACRGSRLVRTWANGQPAFGQYRQRPGGGHRAWGLIVLELSGDRIASMTSFLDVDTFFPRFGLTLDLD